jgi:glyoxylase-like metal-dependent hydrolase (beta-lactamase superfamily II)
MIDVRMFTVGPVQENCYFVRRPGATTAVVIDPGDEAERLLEAQRGLGITTVEAILITHCHFDHVGAVKALNEATGAPVYCPAYERVVLADMSSYMPAEFGPYQNYEADITISGGETLDLAGISFDVRFTPGHSPGHVSYSVQDEESLFSGDVLFQGSVGRVDLPGGDWPTLLASIDSLITELPPQTRVYPGHMGVTTLGEERVSNPFLRELTHR